MDMDRHTIKAVWGFNGTERPGAVYLAAVLAAHSQKGLPAFGIYGHDVQPANAKEIPADVSEKILRFGRAALFFDDHLPHEPVCLDHREICGSVNELPRLHEYFARRAIKRGVKRRPRGPVGSCSLSFGSFSCGHSVHFLLCDSASNPESVLASNLLVAKHVSPKRLAHALIGALSHWSLALNNPKTLAK